MIGSISASLLGSYIYTLQFERFVYIGETQRNPVLRWSQHLTNSGSFKAALAERDVRLTATDRVDFRAFRCEFEHLGIRPVSYRIFTQAIEHELHCLFASERTRVKLVSDTVRTCPPVAFFTESVKLMAKSLFEQCE